MGYQVVFAGQKTHYGVALLSRSSLQQSLFTGFPMMSGCPEAIYRW